MTRDELRATLARHQRQRRQVRRAIQIVIGTALVLSVLNIALAIRAGRSVDFSDFPAYLLVFLGISAGFSAEHIQAARQVAELRDPALAPYLIEFLESDQPDLRDFGRDALIAMAKADLYPEAALIDADHRRILAAALAKDDLPSQQLAAKYLARYGTAAELPALDARATVSAAESDLRMASAEIRLREAARAVQSA
ncbi:MAG: hypothetical protein SFX74_09990 [Fimbriimonadaceae bacterium]|nr:hypothetical protein [Fimbriimonadaceae bacterium]